MQMFDMHSDLSPHGSPKSLSGKPSIPASGMTGASIDPPEPLEPLEPPEPALPPLPPVASASGPAHPTTERKITNAYFIPATSLSYGGSLAELLFSVRKG